MNQGQGCIIGVEGLDASGKFSQTKLIVEYLKSKGKKVKIYNFPQYDTTIGKVIAKYLKGDYGDINNVPYELICIAFGADRASIQNEVSNLLKEGYYIIMDRYTYSNLFTAAKLPYETWSTFIKWIEDVEFGQLGLHKPNYNFYLYVDPQVSIKRIEERGKRSYQDGKEDIHENNKELLINTAKCYLEFAKTQDNWFVIDQMSDGQQLSPEKVFDKIKEKLDIILSS